MEGSEGLWGAWLWWIFAAAFIIGIIWLIIWARGKARLSRRRSMTELNGTSDHKKENNHKR